MVVTLLLGELRFLATGNLIPVRGPGCAPFKKESTMFKCPGCGKLFDESQQLKEHLMKNALCDAYASIAVSAREFNERIEIFLMKLKENCRGEQ